MLDRLGGATQGLAVSEADLEDVIVGLQLQKLQSHGVLPSGLDCHQAGQQSSQGAAREPGQPG